MWPFYKTYRIEYIRGTWDCMSVMTYIRATNISNAVRKLERREWPTKISIIEIVESQAE
jgi:hypothetical protein